MFDRHVTSKLSGYCHGELSPPERRRVAGHLDRCRRCREAHAEIRLGVALAAHLPLPTAPPDLWEGIERALTAPRAAPAPPRPALRGWLRPAAVGAALVLSIVAGGIGWRLLRPSWRVERLAGTPTINTDPIGPRARLGVGGWIETDAASRARIQVGTLGTVEVTPNSRVQLVTTRRREHRLALARGTIHATILAPPRLFFVETPAATAIDLGCAYTLAVDATGAGRLEVTRGWVALEGAERDAFVPAGAHCAMRPPVGPGTPYFPDAAPAFRQALAAFDFAGGRSEALGRVLDRARPRDTLTLWHLLLRADFAQRPPVYERLAGLAPPPAGVTRDGVLALDRAMLEAWKRHLRPHWKPPA